MTLSSDQHAKTIEVSSELAAISAELFGALLAARVPDGAGRGIVNFNSNQAFELTKILLAHAVNEAD